jgi:hypothetical protein
MAEIRSALNAFLRSGRLITTVTAPRGRGLDVH